jgi:hypothetical protein
VAYLPFDTLVVYGRKIDLLFKFGKARKEKIEISANEWRRLAVRNETKTNQR